MHGVQCFVAPLDLRTQVRVATSNSERLTPEQAGQVSNTVQALGYLLQKSGVNNPYPRAYGNVWRMARVGTTKRIPQVKFEEITDWMEKRIQILNQAPNLTSEQESNLLGGVGL